jgi:PPOX class probable F420-dependent enzyme
MDIAGALEFFRTNHKAVIGVRRSDGAPSLTPVAVTVDGDGKLVVSTRETAVKVRHLRREPRAWVCGFTERFWGGDQFALAEGDVEIVSLPAAMDGLIDYYRSISGEHPDWDDYRAAMEKERRCLLRITVDRAGPTIAG